MAKGGGVKTNAGKIAADKKTVVKIDPGLAHLAGIRVCVNLVENYALQAYWKNGESEYIKIREILRKCVEDLIKLAPNAGPFQSLGTSAVKPGTAEPAVKTVARSAAEPEGECPWGTHRVDSMCVPD